MRVINIGVLISLLESFIITNFVIKSLEPRDSKKKWLLYTALTFLLFIDIEYGSIIFHKESSRGIIQIILCFIFSLLFLKGFIYKKILVSIISNLLILVINIFLMTILSTFLNLNIKEISKEHEVWLFAILTSKLIYFIITSFLLTLQKKLLYPITLKEGKVILLIFFITLLIGLSVLEIHIVSGSYDSIYLNITVIVLMYLSTQN